MKQTRIVQGIDEKSPTLQLEDGSVLDINCLLNNKRDLTKLINYFKGVSKFKPLLKELRFGCFGPTLDQVDIVLETIG